MSFDIAKLLGAAGEIALSFVPGAGPVLKGAAAIAELIGGSTGDKIKNGIGMVTEGMKEFAQTPLSPEQQIQQQKISSDAQIALEEIAYKNRKLDYDDQAGGRDVIKIDSGSDDPLVRQARPKMMVLLGKSAIAYSFVVPILVLDMGYLNVSREIISMVINYALWAGGTMWSAFTASFAGYTVARTIDKNTQAKLSNGIDQSKLLEAVSKIGKVIS